MKRFLILLLLPLLLTGCSKPPIVGTDPTTIPTLPEPSGLYVPESELEKSTGGGVKSYPLDEDTYSRLLPLGDGLLLLSRDNTHLTLVTGPNLVPVVEKEIPFHIQHIQTGNEGIAYLNEQGDTLIFLNSALRETGRLLLPEDLIGDPWLTPDWKALYYCTASGLQRLDLETGITHLIAAQESPNQSVSGVFLKGSVVQCQIKNADGSTLTRMLSAENGNILWEGTGLLEFTSDETHWFGRLDRGPIQELLFGCGDTVRNLWPQESYSMLYFIPGQNTVLTYRENTHGCHVDAYDLATGKRAASVFLEHIQKIRDICPDTSGNGIWLLVRNADDGIDAVCHWNLSANPTDDESNYTQVHYTRNDPDEQGLQELQLSLQALQDTYNVAFLIGNAADIAPETLSVETEYLVPAFARYIPTLEALLTQFPEDLFASAAYSTSSGLIHIGLVRNFTGQVDGMPLLHFRQNGELYFILRLDEHLEQSFYHAVSHMIETRLLSTSSVLYDWDALNPEGFSYDNDYKKNLTRDPIQYLQGENRGFVDTFSMSFEREDRARILEYACTSGNEALFQSPILQQKLQLLCTGMREAFSLQEGTFIWEQYLILPSE